MGKKAWSYSALKSYEMCPRKYHEMSVAKNYQDKPSDIMTWGNDVHKAFENNVANGEPFPIGMRQFEPIAAVLRASVGVRLVEQKLALNQNFNPVTWFAKTTWVRTIVDLAVINGEKAVVVDYKTGKRKEDFDQLALMAAVMFNQAEELQTISAMFVWLSDYDDEKPLECLSIVTYNREELPSLWERFQKREEEYQNAHRNSDFPAKPGGLCRRYCPVSTCPYHGG